MNGSSRVDLYRDGRIVASVTKVIAALPGAGLPPVIVSLILVDANGCRRSYGRGIESVEQAQRIAEAIA